MVTCLDFWTEFLAGFWYHDWVQDSIWFYPYPCAWSRFASLHVSSFLQRRADKNVLQWGMLALRLEQESGFFFNMKYFEDQVQGGEWEEVERYLSGFTKVDDNRYSMKIFFEIRKQKYLEALDKYVSFILSGSHVWQVTCGKFTHFILCALSESHWWSASNLTLHAKCRSHPDTFRPFEGFYNKICLP